jgi:hypothetical protein
VVCKITAVVGLPVNFVCTIGEQLLKAFFIADVACYGKCIWVSFAYLCFAIVPAV